MKIAILDDEMHCVESLVLDINRLFPELTIAFKSTKPLEALEVLQRLDVDVLFLDVEMPMMTGFDFLEQFERLPFDVIFTTAYSQYAIKAFKAQAINYLLKPIDEEELREAIENCINKQQANANKAVELDQLLEALKKEGILKNKIAIPTTDGLEFIEINSIIYCQARSNYTNIITESNTEILICRTLKEVEKLLGKFSFVRVHQSYLINPNFMEKYNRNEGGYLMMANNHRIPISLAKRSSITDIFENLRGRNNV